MTTVIVEDLDHENVDSIPCVLNTAHPETDDSDSTSVVESVDSPGGTSDENGLDISESESYITKVPDVISLFSGRCVWMEPDNDISAEMINFESKQNIDLSISSQQQKDNHTRKETDSICCESSEEISPNDLPDILMTENNYQNGNDKLPGDNTSSRVKETTDGLKVESVQDNGINGDLHCKTCSLTDMVERRVPTGILSFTKSVLSPVDGLKGTVGSFVTKTGLEDRVKSLVPKCTSDENDDDSAKVTEKDKAAAEKTKDVPTPIIDKFKRALRVVGILTIVLSFFSIGISVIKAMVTPEKAVTIIISTVLHTLTDVLIIVPAVVGLAFGRIQARLQKDNPPTLLKCCMPVHFGFCLTSVIFGISSLISSVTAVARSEDQGLTLGLEIVHIISVVFTIGANIFGMVFFCKTRNSLLRVFPSGKMTQISNVIKEKTMNLNVLGNRKKDDIHQDDTHKH